MPANLENSAVATGLEKVSFHLLKLQLKGTLKNIDDVLVQLHCVFSIPHMAFRATLRSSLGCEYFYMFLFLIFGYTRS